MTARVVPLHMQERVEKCVKRALEAGVIVRQLDPTDWCSPGFFVKKYGPGSDLLLVVDYTDLNKYVLRHSFPSSTEVTAGLDPDSKYFLQAGRQERVPPDSPG